MTSIATAYAMRLIVRVRRGGALPAGGWTDMAAAAVLGAVGYAALGPPAGLVGLSLAFLWWAGREPAVAAAEM
jgi:hypothetical protein